MNVYVFDLEADGLLNELTKIHCLCHYDINANISVSLSEYHSMVEFCETADILIGHNIQRFDIPALEKILGVKIKAKLVDTLMLSWYLEPERVKHGLEEWGEEFGVPKPVIKDWKNLSLEEYIHRCSEDVKINTLLWKRFRKQLIQIYGNWEKVKPFLDYLEQKMDVAVEQERSGWRLDRAYALESIRKLTEAKEDKLARLIAEMPKKPISKQIRRPSKPFKKDGTYSTTGARWFALLEKKNYPKEYNKPIEEIVGWEEPNPNSTSQVKDWLYSLGWKPETFKYLRDKDNGDIRKIPQINLEHGGGLCPSVRKLNVHSTGIDSLDSLGVINHRLALLNGWIDFNPNIDTIQAQVGGLTNTLRWKHRVAVNLPKVGKAYGEEIRGALIAREGYELCGSDMASLEDRLKQHYIYPYDPKYVEEMNVEGYDPHLSLALLGGEVTEEQVEAYKDGSNKSIKPIRDIFKNGNYALISGHVKLCEFRGTLK